MDDRQWKRTWRCFRDAKVVEWWEFSNPDVYRSAVG
jgi:hypothetical protein